MGASKSKMPLFQVKVAREAEAQMRGKLSEREKDYEDTVTRLDAQKEEYESQYLDLESKHSALQERFLDLKSKFESDHLSSGDFTNRASELNRKLNEALSERDFIKIEAQKQIEELLSNQKSFEDEIRESRMKLRRTEATYEEKIHCLEAERQVLLEESTEKGFEALRLRDQAEDLRGEYNNEKGILKEEYKQKEKFLRNQFDEEKGQLNQQWEFKLNEVMKNCTEEVGKFKTSLVLENSNLQDKLSSALKDINALSKKYKLLNNLFEEIRSRYERRESRKEDLERIADLEGQLIIQSEEIERQRDILKSLKFPAQQGVNTNTNSRRNRRNARKQRQKLNGLINGNENGYDGHGKNVKRGNISASSSGSSSSSDTKGDN